MAKYFFLDWCPCGATPVDCALPVRSQTLPRATLDPYLYKRGNVGDSAAPAIPHADAVTSVKVIARPDGLYVIELDIDPAKGFNLSDLDELAFVAAMVAKANLGHSHYHHNMPGRGRAAKLKPSQILYVSPVQLAPSGWSTRVRQGRLTDADLAAARTAAGPQRDALLELRHRYIRLEDALSFRLSTHRSVQAARLGGWIGWASFLAYGLAAAACMFLFVLPRATDVRPEHYAALIMSSIFVAFGLQFGGRIVTWDVPVIRLLRTAHGFFLSANGVNKVIGRLSGGNALDDFHGVIANLQSRIEGEQHRIGMSQNWMAVTLGAASLVAAVSALNTDKAPTTALVQQEAAEVDSPKVEVAKTLEDAKAVTRPRPLPRQNAPTALPAAQPTETPGAAQSRPPGPDSTTASPPAAPEAGPKSSEPPSATAAPAPAAEGPATDHVRQVNPPIPQDLGPPAT